MKRFRVAVMGFLRIVREAMHRFARRGDKDHGEKQACNQDGKCSDRLRHLSLFK